MTWFFLDWTHTIFRPLRGAAVRSLLVLAWETVYVWQSRSQERYRLHELDEHILRDIGINRADIEREARKPLWKA